MEFKAFTDIERIGKMNMTITQKIHGSNAQIVIYNEEDQTKLLCGSRTRWITPELDNYGFAAFVYANKDEFIEKLGVGTHFGEWAGPGINSGEGLTEKTFVLFDVRKFPADRSLPPQTKIVPLLYTGKIDTNAIDEVMLDLKTNGSKLVPGFMRPEGVVVNIGGHRYKKVFNAEETAWNGKDPNYVKTKNTKVEVDYSHLMQPIRLEKLLSRDEQYILNFPKNLPLIVAAYIEDLAKEDQLGGVEELQCRGQVFKFIRLTMESLCPK